ncbi:MAG TPA: arylesterase [Aestuariivirga sp.]|nr:arylesterase [Aestuariivirga sp.]
MLRPVLLAVLALAIMILPVQARTLNLLALGDSLTAGYGVAAADAFPVKLAAALKARGHDVKVINAGVSGDTAADGLARLDWALGDAIDAAIVELGANDMLRGLDPVQAEQALDEILKKLGEKKIPVLLAGMVAAPNLGADYGQRFNRIYPKLTAVHGAMLYPFFLDGVAGQRALNQPDGMHPNAAGVDEIVTRILPSVEALLARVK